MTKNKYNRVAKLEAITDKREKHLVIPLCCFYSTEDRGCKCKPYWTREPKVIKSGVGAFYEDIEAGCQVPPADAEFIEDWGDIRQ